MQHIDFKTNKNDKVCINCSKLNLSDQSIINAIPYYPIQQERHEDYQVLPLLKIWVDWSDVIGYEEIKSVINRAINVDSGTKPTHLLICGAPGTSKTVFLKTTEASLIEQSQNVHYIDTTTMSSSGVIQYLFENEVKYLLLDEIDKLELEHQRVFLNLLESGVLQETKSKKIRKKSMKQTTIIATGNYMDKIMEPLLTRFMTFEIPKYTKEQFYDIGQKLLISKYKKTKEIAFYIVDSVWNIYTTKRHKEPNLRYARDVAGLTNNDKAVIDPILNAITKYSRGHKE